MMVAVLLGALTLGACVDDNESQSVTDVRNAKAEQLKAAAELSKAQAEAALIQANAEKAYKEALAEYQKAQAAAQQVAAERQAFELEKAKEQYALDLEKIRLQAQFDLQKLKDAMAQYDKNLANEAYNEIDIAYSRYYSALDDLTNKKYDLIDKQAQIAQLEAGVISAEAWNKYNTLQQEQNIANYEAQLAVLKDEAYAGLDNAELQAKLAAKQKECNLAQTAFAKDPTCAALLATTEPVKKAVETWEAQNKLFYAVADVAWIFDSESEDIVYTLYNAVAYNADAEYNNRLYVRKNLRINETQKLYADRRFAADVKNTADALGTAADTKDKATAYGRLAKANDDLKVANEALKTANAMPETTDEEKAAKEIAVNAAKEQISNAEVSVARYKDELVGYQASAEEAAAAQKEYSDAVAAFDVAAYNKAVAALEAAVEAQKEAEDAWNEAKTSINELWSEYDALYYLTWNSSTNINEEIARLEANIATAKKYIENYKYNNNNAERTLERAKVEIEQLEAEIEAKTKQVEAAKALLDSLLASDEETPAE